MNIDELLNYLIKININLQAKEICQIWGMDEASFSRKKKSGTTIKHKNIEQLEKVLDIKLTKSKQVNIIRGAKSIIQADFYSDVMGSCGGGELVFSESKETINLDTKWIKNYSKSDTYSIITAKGDSMSGVIEDKDKLIIKHFNSEQIIDNHIYVFSYWNDLYIKFLSKNIDEIIIRSNNDNYQTKYITDFDNLRIIGEVVGLVRDLG